MDKLALQKMAVEVRKELYRPCTARRRDIRADHSQQQISSPIYILKR